MKKIAAMLAVLTLAAGSAMAQGIFGGYVILATNGGANAYYDTDQATVNPDWTATTVTIDFGQILRIGGQVATFPGGPVGGNNSFDTASIRFSIDGGAVQSLNLPFLQNINANQDDQWEQLPAGGTDIGSALSVGLHTVNVSFRAVDSNGGSGTVNLDNGGAGWTGQINVVPEPSTMVLAGIGLAGLIAARRRMAK